MTKKTIMKKALSVITATTMALSLMTGIPFGELGLSITASAQDAVTSGTCGATANDNVNWSYDSTTGTLTISGTGAMADYNVPYASAPWEYYAENISKVIISNGLTYIGTNAFDNIALNATIYAPCSWNENPLYTFENIVTVNIGEHNNTYSASGAKINAKCSACNSTGTATVSAQGGTYDGTTAYEATVTKTGTLENVTITPVYYNSEGTALDSAPVNVGTYTTKITYGEKTASVKFTIAKATTTADMFAYTAPANLTYDGTEKSATVTTNKDGMGEITVKYYQNNKQVTPKNAGTYTVKINVAQGDNYKAVSNVEVGTFEITKADATVATAPTASTLTYTGKAQKLVSAGATTDGTIQYSLEENGTYSTAIPTGTNAGEYTVWYKVIGDSNHNDSTPVSVTVVIGKAPLTVTANNYTIEVGTALPETLGYTVAGLKGSDTIESIGLTVTVGYDGGTVPTDVGEYTLVPTGAITTDNYNVNYVNGILIITDKEIQTITANNVTLTYGKTAAINAKASGEITYTVVTGDDVIEVVDGVITPKKAGIATVKITAAETATHAQAVKTISVTVNKAKATVTAKSYSIKLGDALPATYEYTITGFVDGTSITPTITCTATDTSKAGTYPIAVTGVAETDKYAVTYVNGKLTVGGSSSSGGSSGGNGGGGSNRPSPKPEIGGESTSWGAVENLISELPYGGEMTINLGECYEVPSYVIEQIAESGAKVTFIVDDNFSCIIDGSKITDKIKTDFKIYITGSINTFRLRGEQVLQFRVGGDNIPVDIVADCGKNNAGKFANLFTERDGDLAFVDNVRVDENGKATLTIKEAGYYAIMVCEFSDRPGDLSNDGKITADDATAILKEITALATSANGKVADYNGDGLANALDASAILIDIKNGKFKTTI